jgi:translation initiation factor 1
MTKDWKERLGVVFSTNPEFSYQRQDQENTETLPPDKQILRVQLDKKQRKGKSVTLITGFTGKVEDLEALAKILKTKCGVGGTAKEGEILIQGDFCKKITDLLKTMGYRNVKRSGG